MKKFNIISLGCAKNLVDSEILLGGLKETQLSITDNPDEADTIIVNTCGFLDIAREESIETILQAAELKKKGNLKEKLFGRGIKSFKINCSIKKFCDTLGGCCSTHPHNLFFQIIAEIGLIGFAIYLYFYLFLIQNLFRSFMGDKNTKFYVINLALFVNFLPIVPSGNLFGTYMTLNFAILISYSIHIFDKYEY